MHWVGDLAEELIREITEQMAGIHLMRIEQELPCGEKDTLYSYLMGEQTMQLQLAAERTFFYRLAKNIIGEEPEDMDEVREYVAEFANIICGRFVSEICRATNTTARFRPTAYGVGERAAEDLQTISFISDRQEMVSFSWSREAMATLLKREMTMNNTVMIVDDSRVIYAEMKKMLAESEFEIIGFCRSGEEALETYGTLRPRVVTMDIVMPGMDGLDTTEELLKRFPDARVVMVSSLAYGDTTQRANEIGAKGFVFKPFDRETLLDALHRAAADGEA